MTLAQNFRFTQALEINGGSKTASELRVCSGSTLILEKGVEVSSYTNLNINGGTLETTTLTLGHRTEGNDNSYYGKLTMSSGSIKADSIYFRNQQGNEVNITGGEVEFTSQNAISYNDKNTSGNRVSINISNATLKASLVDWKLDGKTTAQSQVSNVIIDANNTKKITLNNVALSGTITNNKWLELGGATKATGEVVLAGTGGETTVYGNYEHLKAEGNAESVLNVKSGAVINNLSAKSGVVNISGTHNDLELFDASVNGVSTATVYLEGKAELQANTIWAGANASIYLKEDAKLHVGNGVSFVGKSDATPAEIKSNGNHQYVLSGEKKSSETNTHRADDFTIKNANVYVNSTDTENGVTIGNRIQNSGIINDGIATATLVNGWNNLNSIQALKGDINLQWIDSRMQTSALESLIIEANRAVGAHTTDASLTSLQNNASLTVQGIATIGENASFYGNLIIASGTTLTMADTFNLYGDLTLNGGVTLDGSMLTAIQDLAYGESLAIFDKVSALVFSAVENPTMTLDTEALARVDASLYFTNLEEGIYFITHVDQQVIITSNIPEPTTATLSLLALAALAARRRRR